MAVGSKTTQDQPQIQESDMDFDAFTKTIQPSRLGIFLVPLSSMVVHKDQRTPHIEQVHALLKSFDEHSPGHDVDNYKMIVLLERIDGKPIVDPGVSFNALCDDKTFLLDPHLYRVHILSGQHRFLAYIKFLDPTLAVENLVTNVFDLGTIGATAFALDNAYWRCEVYDHAIYIKYPSLVFSWMGTFNVSDTMIRSDTASMHWRRIRKGVKAGFTPDQLATQWDRLTGTSNAWKCLSWSVSHPRLSAVLDKWFEVPVFAAKFKSTMTKIYGQRGYGGMMADLLEHGYNQLVNFADCDALGHSVCNVTVDIFSKFKMHKKYDVVLDNALKTWGTRYGTKEEIIIRLNRPPVGGRTAFVDRDQYGTLWTGEWLHPIYLTSRGAALDNVEITLTTWGEIAHIFISIINGPLRASNISKTQHGGRANRSNIYFDVNLVTDWYDEINRIFNDYKIPRTDQCAMIQHLFWNQSSANQESVGHWAQSLNPNTKTNLADLHCDLLSKLLASSDPWYQVIRHFAPTSFDGDEYKFPKSSVILKSEAPMASRERLSLHAEHQKEETIARINNEKELREKQKALDGMDLSESIDAVRKKAERLHKEKQDKARAALDKELQDAKETHDKKTAARNLLRSEIETLKLKLVPAPPSLPPPPSASTPTTLSLVTPVILSTAPTLDETRTLMAEAFHVPSSAIDVITQAASCLDNILPSVEDADLVRKLIHDALASPQFLQRYVDKAKEVSRPGFHSFTYLTNGTVTYQNFTTAAGPYAVARPEVVISRSSAYAVPHVFRGPKPPTKRPHVELSDEESDQWNPTEEDDDEFEETNVASKKRKRDAPTKAKVGRPDKNKKLKGKGKEMEHAAAELEDEIETLPDEEDNEGDDESEVEAEEN